MSLRLFQEFSPITEEEWRREAESALKGREISSLHYSPEKNIHLKPWYAAKDVAEIAGQLSVVPGKFPFRRGNRFHAYGPGWQIVQEISADQPAARQILQETTNENPDAISLSGYFRKPSSAETEPLLSLIDFSRTALHLDVAQKPVQTVLDLVKILLLRKMKRAQLTGSLYNDPISAAAITGKAVHPVDMAHCEGGMINGKNLPNFRTLGLDFSWVHEMGGTITQELAFALAVVTDYLAFFEETQSPLSREKILENIAVTFSVGSNFFMEMAKLRAFRILFAQLTLAWGETNPDRQSPFLIARTSRQHLSLYDRHNNLLRGTTAALSAISGGANAVIVTAFDRMKGPENTQSVRLSRNIQLLLRHESYVGKVTDPGGGAWFPESLTDQLAEAAWNLFQKMEKLGGFTRMMAEGKILQLLEQSAGQSDIDFATRKSVMVGVNQYPSQGETFPEVHTNEWLSPFEVLRLEMDKKSARTGRQPVAFLLGLGEGKMQNARKNFARNLLGCLGIQIAEEGEWEKIRPEVVVLCSSDAGYFSEGREIIGKIRNEIFGARILIAGKPEGIEALGADDYLYAGMNALEFLQQLAATI
ncbi:MAG: methylmalonyl-CoA mutase family protein [Bacteroidia bacterium]